MIGTTISHYKILEKLGSGGMGVVYKAEDTRLKRCVVLKFLPPELTCDEEAKERFANEAQAASALDHPNICTIYEIDEISTPEEAGQMFIAMACYEGETLKEKVASGPDIPLKTTEGKSGQVAEVIDMAIQIAEGLARAHEHGIVHRDVKPANIIVTNDGLLKIIDFGLAKLTGTKGITRTPLTMGTVAYMSPEQVEGERVDHRTDIWSLGVVLYEMLTGELPFKGVSDPPVIYSILNEEPKPVIDVCPDLPPVLDRIVQKALEKDCRKRYQHMGELMADLKLLRHDSASRAILSKSRQDKKGARQKRRSLVLPGTILASAILAVLGYFYFPTNKPARLQRIPIAVLDVVNETHEEELNGLSGMLITSLEQSHRLSILTRSRMFDILKKLDQENIDYIDESLGKEICRYVNVQVLLRPTVRKLGKLYSIELLALDPNKDEYLFAARESGEGQESIFGMIDALSDRTRRELNPESTDLRAAGQKSIAEVTTVDLDAYHHYFRGEQLFRQSKLSEAEQEYRKAIENDSTFALAYYKLATLKAWFFGEEYLAKEPMQKALSLIEHLPEKYRYLVRAQQARFAEGFEESMAILQEMEQNYPDDEQMIFDMGYWAYWAGQYSTAAQYLERFLEFDSKNPLALQRLTETYEQLEWYEKMLAIAKHYVAESPSLKSYGMLAIAYMNLEKYDAAIQMLEQARQFFPEDYKMVDLIANFYMLQGNYEKTATKLQTLLEESQPPNVKQWGRASLANLNLYRGKYREALKYRDRYIQSIWLRKDTTWAASQHFEKANLFIWGWNDMKRARTEVEKALALKNKIISPFFWIRVAAFYAVTGEDALADSIARSISQTPSLQWVHPFVTAMIQSRDQDCNQAQTVADFPIFRGGYRHLRIFMLYLLAKCQFEQGEFENALESLDQMQKIFTNLYGIRPVFYPKSLYLRGRIYESTGKMKPAIEHYEKLLELWKEADEDLPELIDAKKRLANLSGTATEVGQR